MNYKKEEIIKGINLHTVETNKFKTNLFAIMLTTKITKENATKNALISLILRRGTKNLQTQEKISEKLENMYGASFDCGIDKIGDNQVIKFYLESLNNEYLPEQEDNFKQSLETIIDIAFNPYVGVDDSVDPNKLTFEDNSMSNDVGDEKFNKQYFESEKQKLKEIIESKKDNKTMYAFNRCIEEMYKNKPYGIYKFGNIEDLENITNEELYKYYKQLIKTCKIDIYVSGNIQKEIKDFIKNNENIKKLQEREPNYNVEVDTNCDSKIKEIEENMDVTQGKLVIGLNLEQKEENSKNIALVYNSILGGTANSKLFQNVREKESLAYTASSNYVRQKANIFIRCGIEIENYNKAVEIIKKQIEDMKKGDFTEEELENTKQYIISTIQAIEDEQDTQIAYCFGQELTGTEISLEKYIEKINSVTKQQVTNLAQTVKINTIYFLRN